MAKTQLHPIHGCQNPDRAGDVIFVHGLNGNPHEYWCHGDDRRNYWPGWLGEDVPKVGVWSLGYENAAFKPRRLSFLRKNRGFALPLTQRAGNVLLELKLRKIGQRPIVFITHSMGGLLVKQLIRAANDSADAKDRAILDQTKGVCFIATPHIGSDLAKWGTYFRTLLGTNVSMDELRPHEPLLLDLKTWYSNFVTKQGTIKTLSFYETKPLPRAGIRVVEPGDADPGVPLSSGHYALDEDHRTICKPESRDALVSRAVLSFVKEDCLHLPEEPHASEPEPPGAGPRPGTGPQDGADPPKAPSTLLQDIFGITGWFALLLGILVAAIGLLFQTRELWTYLPRPVQAMRVLSLSSWLLLVALPVITGVLMIRLSHRRAFWSIGQALLGVAVVVAYPAWREVRQYMPDYQIEVIRESKLVDYASAEDDPRLLEIVTAWAIALALDDQVPRALEAAATLDPDRIETDPRLDVAAALERAGRRPQADEVWKDAARVARGHATADRQCRALADLSRAFLAANRLPEAKLIAEEARGKADADEGIAGATLARVLVAHGQVLTRDKKDVEAKQTWEDALVVSQGQIPEPEQRYRAFAEVARGAAAVGEVTVARGALSRCRELPPPAGIRPEDRPDGIAEVMTTLFLAERSVEAAKNLAYEIPGRPHRARSLIAVAQELEKLDRQPEADAAFRKAAEACAPSNDHAARASSCAAVAAALDRAGRPAEAQEYWSKAIIELGRLEDRPRQEARCRLAEDFVRAGRPDRALALAGSVPLAADRSEALSRAGRALALAAVIPLEPETLERIDGAARAIKQDRLRSPALAAVAKGFARLELFREARLRGAECRRSLDELDVYALILLQYHRSPQAPPPLDGGRP